MRVHLRVLGPAIALIFLTGCGQAQAAFREVELCVGDSGGVEFLKRAMVTAAQAEGLKFIDNSEQQGVELKTIGADEALKGDASLAIGLHIEGPSGLGATATNLGLPPYQIGLGFTEGNDPARAHRLANRLIASLDQRFEVEQVVPGKGISPLKNCGA